VQKTLLFLTVCVASLKLFQLAANNVQAGFYGLGVYPRSVASGSAGANDFLSVGFV